MPCGRDRTPPLETTGPLLEDPLGCVLSVGIERGPYIGAPYETARVTCRFTVDLLRSTAVKACGGPDEMSTCRLPESARPS